MACLSACSKLEDLPFLKHRVDNEAHGARSTERGPAFHSNVSRARPIDTTVDWAAYNNTFSSTRFSPQAQITTTNVARLRVACTADLGEQAVMQSGPIVVNGVMYVTSAVSTWAIDAATCRLRWKHTYKYWPRPEYDLKVNRGVAYLDTPEGHVFFVVRMTGDCMRSMLRQVKRSGTSKPAMSRAAKHSRRHRLPGTVSCSSATRAATTTA